MAKRHVYRLDIATESGLTTDESVRCLRAMLKAMLRSYGVRCLSAIAVEPLSLIDEATQRKAGNKTGVNQHTKEVVGIVDNVNNTSRPTGTSKDAALRRLRKDRADVPQNEPQSTNEATNDN